MDFAPVQTCLLALALSNAFELSMDLVGRRWCTRLRVEHAVMLDVTVPDDGLKSDLVDGRQMTGLFGSPVRSLCWEQMS